MLENEGAAPHGCTGGAGARRVQRVMGAGTCGTAPFPPGHGAELIRVLKGEDEP